MTLLDIIHRFEIIASKQPSINMIVENDIFRLNANPSSKYGVFGWTQGQHTGEVNSSFIDYSFTFFYVDRLRNDKKNEVEVQSVGIETLSNIIRELDESGVVADNSYTFTTFNQRFLDECSGVFVNVTLSVPVNSTCAEVFGDYNDDFNDDFLIW